MKRGLPVMLLTVLLISSCAAVTPSATATPSVIPTSSQEVPRVLRVMTYSSFDISEEVVTAFESTHNAKLQFLDAGDTGQMVSQAVLSVDNPQADVMYGIDNTFLSRALDAGIFVSYEAQALSKIPAEYQLDDQHRVSPVDFGDVCLNYDRAYFEDHALAVPQSLEDLAKPEYRGLLVAENPASSSPGLAFLLATIDSLGQDNYLAYWQALRDNDVLIVDSWDTAYYTEFSGGVYSEGARPLVVSYATSPAAEIYFSEEPLDVPPTGAVTAAGTCFRQIEFVGILKNGQNPDLAQAFVDFVLSDTFQNDIPLHMFVFPASQTATLPQVFADFAVKADRPATMAVNAIEQNRETWIQAWSDVVLR